MRTPRSFVTAAAGLLLLVGNVSAIDVDPSDEQSLTDAAKTIAASIMSRYDGDESGNVPGLFPRPYYFWESGLAWDSLLWYESLTGDDQYSDIISQSLLWQVGPDYNYLPPNQSKSIGNDDQSFWALAAMTAKETGFQAPSGDGVDSWIQLAQNVFDSQAARWDNDTCGGGLRWQIFSFNNGYNYKNSASNGNFAYLAARLYAATQNETYATWFDAAVEWLGEVGLVDEETGAVYDGTDVDGDCEQLNRIQWSQNSGMLIGAYGSMLDATGDVDKYSTPFLRIYSHALQTFAPLPDSILTEPACIPGNTCNVDQVAFRAVLARAMATTNVTIQPEFTNTSFYGVLPDTAEAVGQQCSGGSNSTTCGNDWSASSYDGSDGLSEDLSALNVVLANLDLLMNGTASSTNSTNSSTGSGSASGGLEGSQTSSGDGSQASGGANNSAGADVQGENRGEQRAASMFGLLGALGFAVAFFL